MLIKGQLSVKTTSLSSKNKLSQIFCTHSEARFGFPDYLDLKRLQDDSPDNNPLLQE